MSELMFVFPPSMEDLQNATIVVRFLCQLGVLVLTGGLLVRRTRRWAKRRRTRHAATNARQAEPGRSAPTE
jgi:hypothetical protein